ncbi:hypothetical protein KQI65_01855 [bacterium]|nr:hypothetical protein [bacterium]
MTWLEGRNTIDRLSIMMLIGLLVSIFACTEDTLPDEPQPVVHMQQDTTSHEIDWKVYVFGPGIPSSYFLDIKAFSDSNVWVGGFVYMGERDSTGHYPDPSAVFHWDGVKWTDYQVPLGRCKSENSYYGAIFSLDGRPSDMYFTDQVGESSYYNGISFSVTCYPRDPDSYYGVGSDDIFYTNAGGLYFCGEYPGRIARLINGEIETLVDIPGAPFHSIVANESGDIWCAGHNPYKNTSAFYRYDKNGVLHDISKDFRRGIDTPLKHVTSVWVSADSLYAAAGPFLYIQDQQDTSHYIMHDMLSIDPTNAYYECITGTADNDVFVGGHFMSLIHYNGKSLRYYPDLYDMFGGGIIYGISATHDYVYVCGEDRNTRAVIGIGKRR